ATRVAPDGLQVAIFERADPDVRPCRWNGERANARDRLGIADGLAARRDIAKSAATAAAADARAGVRDVPQAGCARGRGRQRGELRVAFSQGVPRFMRAFFATRVPAVPLRPHERAS